LNTKYTITFNKYLEIKKKFFFVKTDKRGNILREEKEKFLRLSKVIIEIEWRVQRRLRNLFSESKKAKPVFFS